VSVDEFADGLLEGLHAPVCAASNLFVGELSKPTLDEIDPRTVGCREVNVERGRLANQLRMRALL
jgi:hypothetical protein